jgi:voltage-gated potassium channel
MLFIKKFIRIFKKAKIPILIYLLIAIGYGFYFYFSEEKYTAIDVFYYLVTTATTVGYGDISPSTQLGRLIAPFYMSYSIILMGWLLTIAGEKFLQISRRKLKGEIKMNKVIGLTIVGFSKEDKLKKIIEEIRSDSSFEDKEVLIVNNVMDESYPWMSKYNIRFKKSRGSDLNALREIHIEKSEKIIILANDVNDESSDDYTVSNILAIRSISREVKIIAESVREDTTLLETAGANVVTDVTRGDILAKELLDEGSIDFHNSLFSSKTEGTQFNSLLTNNNSESIFNIRKESITWKELIIKAIDYNVVLEGYKLHGMNDFNFLPTHDQVLPLNTVIKYRASKRF